MTFPERLRRLAEYQVLDGMREAMEEAAERITDLEYEVAHAYRSIDRAEARLADVWDEAVRSANLVESNSRMSIEHDLNPYRTEVTG
jgi:hypothetical protein